MTKKTQYTDSHASACDDCRPNHNDKAACDGKAFVVGRTIACEQFTAGHRFTRSLHCPSCCPDLQDAKDPDPVDDFVPEAIRQREDLKRQFLETIPSLRDGLEAYLSGGWTWNPEDMRPTDPYEWKRIPRLCLIFAQFYAIKSALEFQASTSPLRPFWCITCRGEYPGRPYLLVECVDHDASPAAAYEWARFFGAP